MLAAIVALRRKGRTFSYIAEEIGVCSDVIGRELRGRLRGWVSVCVWAITWAPAARGVRRPGAGALPRVRSPGAGQGGRGTP